MIKPVIGRPPEIIEIGVQHLKADPEGFLGPWFVDLGDDFCMGSPDNLFTSFNKVYGSRRFDIYDGIPTRWCSTDSFRPAITARNLQGVLITQATEYFSTFGYESLPLFLLVVSGVLLSLLVGRHKDITTSRRVSLTNTRVAFCTAVSG